MKNDEVVKKNPGECHSCGYITKELKWYECRRIPRDPDGKWLCKVCANTHVGTASEFPEQQASGIRYVLTALAWGINYLRDEITEEIKSAVDEVKQHVDHRTR